jgi:DAACS family dicarboxylate/amino acid:cation (Na+ or H+) symporter
MLLGFAVGIALGAAAHSLGAGQPWLDDVVTNVSRPIGAIFLRLLFLLVLPLLGSAIVLGVAGFGDVRTVGGMGLRTLAATAILSSIAVLLGLFLVNALDPGAAVTPEARERLIETGEERAATTLAHVPAPREGLDLLIGIVPANMVGAAAAGDYLAIMFVALFFGIGLLRTRTPASQKLLEIVQGVFDVSMKLIEIVLRFAPFGIAALLFTQVAELGFDVLLALARFAGVVVLGLAIQQFVVYGLALRLIAGRSPWSFLRGSWPALITAFSTASSNATLPTALKVADERLGLPSRVSRFVLTIGSTANQNGTALYEGVSVLFIAQVYGVDLSLAQQLTVLLVCILGGIGTAGVPAGSLPVIAMILTTIDVPAEGIAMIIGADRFLDMCRTTLNVSGDLTVAALVAPREPPPTPPTGPIGTAREP